MSTFNTLRDRLLLRLLSQPSRDALYRVIFQCIDDDIRHFNECGHDPDIEHVAPSLCHLADLIEERPEWTPQLTHADA